MCCEHKITARRNGGFLFEGEGVIKEVQNGDMLSVKMGTNTIKLTFTAEEGANPEAEVDSLLEKEKGEKGNSEDIHRLAIASWIVAKKNCWDVSCDGSDGRFKGTPCPMSDDPYCAGPLADEKAAEWIKKYHERKAEATKKQEPNKFCKDCRHVPDRGIDRIGVEQIVLCEKKGHRVPAYLVGCPDFDDRAEATEVSIDSADAFISSIERLRDSMSEKAQGSACSPGVEDRRIVQLKKENAGLRNTNAHLRKELDAATKENSRLIEQFKQMGQRIKDLEHNRFRLFPFFVI